MAKAARNRISALAMACLLSLGTAAAMPAAVLSASAEDSTYGDMTYQIVDDHIEITGCDKTVDALVIPSSIDGVPVTRIGNHAFENAAFSSVVIPDSVTEIGYWSFSCCTNLTTVDIPGSVPVVEKDAFTYCSSLETVTLHEGLVELEQGVFSDTPIRSITFPESLVRLRSGVFSYCTSLEEVNFPSHQVDVYSNVFMETPWLKARQAEDPLVIVDGTLIDGSTCTGDVVIPDTVTIIASQAFAMNTAITSVVIPASVKNIWDETFYYCSALKSVEIHGVEYIGPGTFSHCTALESLSLPGTLREIGEGAFTGINKRIPVSYGGTQEQWQNITIGDDNLLFRLAEFSYAEPGDVSGDGVCDVLDVVMLQKWLVRTPGTELACWKAADYNDDSRLDIQDLALLKRALVK